MTREALPFYVANLALFRGILAVAIGATVLLGLASMLLLRSKAHGAFGILLAAIALAMGGPQAQALDTGAGPFAAGLDYFILELLVLGLLFIPLERVYALRPQRIFRAGWQTDLKHFFVSHAGVQLLTFAAMVPAQALFAWAVRLDFQQAVAAQPVWLQFIEIVLIVDLVSYWVHRAFHEVPWLWSFHAIHHSSRQMDWLAGSRMHIRWMRWSIEPLHSCRYSSSASRPGRSTSTSPSCRSTRCSSTPTCAGAFPACAGSSPRPSTTIGITLPTMRGWTGISPCSCRCGTSCSAPRISPGIGRRTTVR